MSAAETEAHKAEQKAQQREDWGVASEAWERCDAWLEIQLADVTAWLVEAARIAPGHRVLDLASGTGHPATAIAARVGAGGSVVATDLSPAMLAVARRRIERLGLGNVELREMDAEQVAFPDAAFDAATCRFGLMFCPEPERAAREVHRVLRPGGRFAVAVWDEAARNPFFTTIGEVAARFVAMPPPDPAAPGPFRLGAPGELARVLTGAGFRDVTVEPRAMAFTYRSPEHYWEIQRELARPIKAARASLPPEAVARLEAAVLALGAAHVVDGEVRIAATPLCATATR